MKITLELEVSNKYDLDEEEVKLLLVQRLKNLSDVLTRNGVKVIGPHKTAITLPGVLNRLAD